jgi:DNA replication and repair protein RecF
MFLKKLSVINFKNFDSKEFNFDANINCFVGNNGVGKTNVLDAIYYLSFAKSYFNPVASQNVRHEEDFFFIEGEYERNNKIDQVICSYKKGQQKLLKFNGKEFEKFADYIGTIPLVIISPADRDLIIEGSETRRKFMDGVISQLDNLYLKTLINYNRIIAQRNVLLKYFAANRKFDPISLQVYDEQLEQYGSVIFNKRRIFLEKFIPIFKTRYQEICNEKEQVDLVYDSKLFDCSVIELLHQNIEKDRILQYTSVGVHKDDLNFMLNGFPIKKYGSQGQQKSFLVALKLAQFDFIKQKTGANPILLLDDIFDKLDDLRVAQIINLVNQDDFGQIFITDTHKERTEEVIKTTHQSYQIFEL